MKSFLLKAASEWYSGKMMSFLGQVETGEITEDGMRVSLDKLMSMPRLRDELCGWLHAAGEYIKLPLTNESTGASTGENLIRKAWRQIYLDPSSVDGFLANAEKEHAAREKKAELTALAARAVASVESFAAGGAGAADAAVWRAAMIEAAVAAVTAAVPDALPEEVQACAAAEAEKHVHLEESSKQAKKKAQSSGKKRRRSQVHLRAAAGGAAGDSEGEGQGGAGAETTRLALPAENLLSATASVICKNGAKSLASVSTA